MACPSLLVVFYVQEGGRLLAQKLALGSFLHFLCLQCHGWPSGAPAPCVPASQRVSLFTALSGKGILFVSPQTSLSLSGY